MKNEYQRLLTDLIQTVYKEGGSDLHLSEGRYPIIRVNGVLIPLVKKELLSGEHIQAFLDEMLSPQSREKFTKEKEVDWNF